MVDETRAPQPPPWNWKALPEVQREVEMEALAEWVAELQEGYGRWVRLPDCWPLHRALLEELKAFWYWRQGIDSSPDAAPRRRSGGIRTCAPRRKPGQRPSAAAPVARWARWMNAATNGPPG